MKKISAILTLLIISFFASSCEEENVTTQWVNPNPLEVQDLKIIPPIIIKNNYTTATLPNTGRTEVEGKSRGYDFLAFEREIDFWAATGQNNNKNEEYLKNWKNIHRDFYSLEDEINDNFAKYDALLDQVERQFSDISQITPEIENKIDNEIENLLQPYASIISYSKEEGVERKTFSAVVDYLLNRDGVVKVEGKIYQYKNDVVKMIIDGDVSKISLLDNIIETDESLGIHVFPIQNNTYNGGRVEGFSSLSSCDTSNGGFRIIAYEEEAVYFNYARLKVRIFYQIKLRSLRRRFRWWGNRKTKQHHSQGSYYANFNPASTPTVSYSTPALQTEVHTYIYPLASLEANSRSPEEALEMSKVISSNHSASGAHNTACNFGI